MCRTNYYKCVNKPFDFILSLSPAVVTALKSLQEKIRKLELDRSKAKANLDQLSSEAKQCQEKLQEERKLTTPRSQSTSPAGTQFTALIVLTRFIFMIG